MFQETPMEYPGGEMRTAVALLVATVAAQWAFGALAADAAGGDITTACAGVVSGTTFTLTANCDTTATLTVPDGFTVDGAGHETTAHDPNPSAGQSGLFLGPVLTNAGAAMNLTDLTVRGTGFTSFGCNAGATPTVGVLYNNASGAITDVQVLDITQHSTCQTVHSIQLRSDAGPQTVSITGSTVSNYQRTALLVQGAVTVDASGNTFGPPDPQTPNPGGLAQNTIQIGSPALAEPSSGTLTDNTIISSSFGAPGATSAGLLLAGAAGVTVSHNTFTGDGTDVGVSFFGANTGITLAYNTIDRSAENRPGFKDAFGYGVDVTDASRPYTTLICNTFARWNQNLVNTTQAPCITTAADLPCMTVGEPVDLNLAAFDAAGVADLTWELTGGELPAGLTLHQDGTITGTPAETGPANATIEAVDPDEGTATRSFTFCVKPPAASHIGQPETPQHAGELAESGTHAATAAAVGAALLGTGLVTVYARRRSTAQRKR
jgi:hypothetical protein